MLVSDEKRPKAANCRIVSSIEAGTRFFSRSPLPLVRYLEIMLSLRAGLQLKKIGSPLFRYRFFPWSAATILQFRYRYFH